MNSGELHNPFVERAVKNANDVEFVRGLLGEQAAEFFSSLDNTTEKEFLKETDTLMITADEQSKLSEADLEQEVESLFRLVSRCEFHESTLKEQNALRIFKWFFETGDFRRLPELSIHQLQLIATNFHRLIDTCGRLGFSSPAAAAPSLFSALVRRPGEDLSLGYFKIDLNGLPTLDYLGIEWQGGTLRLVGQAGDKVGFQMIGGFIEVDRCDDRAGEAMVGGELRIGRAGDHLGSFAKGGVIRAHHADGWAGDHLLGGTLLIDECENDLGSYAQAGVIRVKKAGDCVGPAIPARSAVRIELLSEEYGEIARTREGGTIIRPDGSEIPVGMWR